MKRILKHHWQDREKIYFSSDWHIFHDPPWEIPLWKSRGYESAEDAARKIQERINQTVPEDGIIYYMGDMFLNASDEQCIEWLKGVNCKNIFKIWGNHTSNTFRLYKEEVKKQYGLDDVEVYPLQMGNVTFLGDYQEIRVGKQIIVMSHFPIHSWDKMSYGSIMISGHQHLSDKTRWPDYPLGKCFDCGWDWKKDLWSFEEMMDVISTKTFVKVDHH